MEKWETHYILSHKKKDKKIPLFLEVFCNFKMVGYVGLEPTTLCL